MKMRRRKFQRLSTKIVLIILGITFLVSNVSGVMLYHYFSNVMLGQMRKDNQVTVNQLSMEIDNIYEEAQKYGQQILINKSVQKYFSEDIPTSVVETFKQKKEIMNYVNQMIILSEHISSIALVKDDEEMVWSYIPFWDEISMGLCREWYRQMSSVEENTNISGEEDQNTVSKPYTFSYTRKKGETEQNLISIRIPSYSSERISERLGSVIINIECSTIDQIIQRHSGNFDALGYVNESEKVFCIKDSALHETIFDNAKKETNKDKFPIILQQGTRVGGTIIAILGEPDLFDSKRIDILILLLVLLCCIFLIAVILIPLMLKLTHPVLLLTNAMEKVGTGDLETQVKIHTRDEFETLGQDFNQMVIRLNASVQASIQHERDKHDLEYEVLVAQINPHFIYNTLNTIIYLAKRERGRDVVKITKALIDLLQDGIKLSDNKNYSTIEEELWIIHNYICIQNYRYKDMFELVVDCSEEYKKEVVPTSVIQPLVENALFHGIVPLGHKGRIWLTLAKVTHNSVNFIKIIVADEGVGISAERARAIMDGSLRLTDVSRNHIGVQNIMKRLTLLYDENFHFSIKEREGGGTLVEILLPMG